jgi:hypothetical protein
MKQEHADATIFTVGFALADLLLPVAANQRRRFA